jgi:hypothetical protein
MMLRAQHTPLLSDPSNRRREPRLRQWPIFMYFAGSVRLGLSAKVAELADAPDLGSGGETHEGSSPSFRTNNLREKCLRRYQRPDSRGLFR